MGPSYSSLVAKDCPNSCQVLKNTNNVPTYQAVAKKYDESVANGTDFKNCFSFHGLDVLIDDSGKFWLLEFNASASISSIGSKHPQIKELGTKNEIRVVIFS